MVIARAQRARSNLAAAWLVRAAVALLGTACGHNRPPPPDLPAVGGQVSLFRFPREGGSVRAYHPDSLAPSRWTSQRGVPAVRRLLGADPDERVLWALDVQGNLFSVDLESGAVRSVVQRVSAGVLGPDGSLYLADAERRVVRVARRQPVRFHDPLPAAPKALFGTVNDQLVVLTVGPPFRLITANAEQPLHSTTIPRGEAAATAWGDLVAVATDSAVLLYETGGQRSQRSLSAVRHTRRIGFSPSGHRMYLIQDRPEIRVFDRFTLDELSAIRLPERPREFRVDASGRWLLAQPLAGDSIWVIDLATNALAATVAGGWAADLPLVAGAATLVVRQGDTVAAFDLRRTPPQRIAGLPGAAGDFWLAAAWVPPERVPTAVAAAESASVLQDSALRVDTTQVRVDSTAIYLQVSRTQNSEWAGVLAKQLRTDGYPTSILPPAEPEDGYRVLIGPFLTREAADSTGKRLGRAYFLVHLPERHQ